MSMKTLLTTLAIASVVVFTGCNTIKGAGQDVSKVGDAVSDAAQDTQNRM